MELSEYEQKRGTDRQLYVKINCEVCGAEKWVRWTRVKNGQGRFCGQKCFGIANQKGKDKLHVGYENAEKVFDKNKNAFYVYWYDVEDTSKRHTTSYAKWFWEINNGLVPDGYRASYKDGNSLNINPENIIIISPEEFGAKISERLMGHGFSEDALQKMSDAKKGKPLSEEHKQHIGEATKKMWDGGVFDAPEIRASYSEQGKKTKGSKRTVEQRQAMSLSRKGRKLDYVASQETIEKRRKKLLGKKQSLESNLKRSATLKNRKFTSEHLENLSIAGKNRTDLRGKNSRWWKGGVSEEIYPLEFSVHLKNKVRRRDQHKCQSCGENVYRSKRGHVHHVNGNKQDCGMNNLLLLCATCHNAVHGRNTITSPMIEYLKMELKK